MRACVHTLDGVKPQHLFDCPASPIHKVFRNAVVVVEVSRRPFPIDERDRNPFTYNLQNVIGCSYLFPCVKVATKVSRDGPR